MQRPAATIVTALLILALTMDVNVAALGINCRGSSLCANRGNAVVTIRDAILKDIDPFRQYRKGQQIACTDSNICAFVQNFDFPVFGGQLAPLMQYLVDHRCATCGSVPLDYPHSNDVAKGELTLNYVTNRCVRKAGTVLCV